METRIKLNINLWTIIAILAALFLVFRWFNLRSEINRWESNYKALKTNFETYQSDVTGMIVSKNETIELTQKELDKALKSDSVNRELAEKYKRQLASIEVETEYIHDTVKVQVPIIIENDTTIKYQDKCIELDFSFKDQMFTLNDVQIQNKQNILLGDRKNGFFQTTQSIDIVNSNPCIRTTGVQSYVVKIDKKWYNNPWITIPVSFATGYITSSVVNTIN